MFVYIAKYIFSIPPLNLWVQDQFRSPSKWNPLGWVAQKAMIDMNSVSSQEIVSLLELKENDKITAVELGPGNGISIQALLDTNGCQEIFSIEPSKLFQEILQHKFASNEKVHIHPNDAKDLNVIQDSTVDVVLALNVIYFLDPLPDYWKELHRICKPGARLVFGVTDAVKANDPSIFVNTDWDVCQQELEKAGFVDVKLTKMEKTANPMFEMLWLSCKAGNNL